MLQNKKLKQQQTLLEEAHSYEQWRESAQAHDDMSGMSDWRRTEQTSQYDHTEIRQRLDRLRAHRANQDHHGMLYTLNEGIHGNMAGMGRSALYNRSKLGTKHLIEDYVEEICSALRTIASVDESEINSEEKFDFFNRASHCFGRSALMLSGGGSLGHFHIGVAKALLEQDLLPSVISGASAGSVVAAILGTRTNDELLEFMTPENMVAEAREEATWFNRAFLGQKAIIDIHELEETLERLIPNLTFQEAYKLTGRNINISIAPAELHQSSRLLNAITSPNVYIRTAVMASCAVPGVFPAVTLEAKNIHGESQPYLPTRKWVDGSVSDDLPAKRLARLYGVNHYIGSLINPIVMFAHDQSTEGSKFGDAARKLSHKSVSMWAEGVNTLTRKYGQNWPRVNLAASMVHSIFKQEYDADIAIFPDFKRFRMHKLISQLNAEELIILVQQGERATWQRIDMIRTCSKISATLEEILASFAEKEHLRLAKP